MVDNVTVDNVLDLGFNQKRAIISNNNTPIEILEKLTGDDDYKVRLYMAKYKFTPQEILSILFDDTSHEVCLAVARNENAPSEVLIRLSNLNEDKIKDSAISNRNFPVDKLKELYLSSDKYKRLGVAKNINTPLDILEFLSHDIDEIIRGEVAKNINTPLKTLEFLSNDRRDSVRVKISGRRDFWELSTLVYEWVFNKRCHDLFLLLHCAPLSLLERLYPFHYIHESFRGAIVANKNVSTTILNELINDSSEDVRNDAIDRLSKMNEVG